MAPPEPSVLSDFEQGVIVGLLIGQGHLGGDGRQPQITLRMHVRHETLLRWLVTRLPQSRLYGPYDHDGRRYFQWMVRGRGLVEELLPVLEQHVTADVDAHAFARLQRMTQRYADPIARTKARIEAATSIE